jgi:uncharacterized membrane protein YqjE
MSWILGLAVLYILAVAWWAWQRRQVSRTARLKFQRHPLTDRRVE